jgi:hypothetical protein
MSHSLLHQSSYELHYLPSCLLQTSFLVSWALAVLGTWIVVGRAHLALDAWSSEPDQKLRLWQASGCLSVGNDSRHEDIIKVMTIQSLKPWP